MTRLNLYLLLSVALAGCTMPPNPEHQQEADGGMSWEERLKQRAAHQSRVPERVPSPAPLGGTGEVPEDMLDAVIADALNRSGRTRTDVQILHAQSTVWNDGSLGCPKPGVMYTQALVEGYRIVLKVADHHYDYRATQHGQFVLCDQPLVKPPSNGPANE